MQIQVAEVAIEIEKKKIKNMHLYVKPPLGRVVISAPVKVPNKAIELFARSNLPWVRRQIKKFQEQPRAAKRQYVSGETLFLWGVPYVLKVIDAEKTDCKIDGDKILLYLPKESSVEWRDRFMREIYRAELCRKVEVLLPKWEAVTGLQANEWRTKYMKTRWGTCNISAKRIWLNVQLAQKSLHCLEYVILHELIHLTEKQHNERFYELMDKFMPEWQSVREQLNAARLDAME